MILFHRLWPPASTSSPASAAAPRLTLLHGMGGTGALWRPLAATLEDRFRILSLDQRGHGQSQATQSNSGTREPLGYAPLDYGRDVVETLRELEFHPTWLLGHSMGVRTACAAAHLAQEQHPADGVRRTSPTDLIQGLILVDLGLAGPAGGGLGENLAQFVRVLPTRFASREAARTFMTSCPDPSIAQYLMAVSVKDTDGSILFPFDHQALIQTLEAAQNSSVRPWVRELGERGMPILVLRGAESGVWTHAEFEDEKARFADLPSIVFEEMEGGGHGLPFERRIPFADRVARFMTAGT